MVTDDEVEAAAISAGLTYVPHHECSICAEWVGHSIYARTGNLFFEPACGCSYSPPEQRSWQSVADEINMQNDECRVKLMQKWGMGSNVELTEHGSES